MKKSLVLGAFAAFFVLGMTSCKKDYTCECTTTTAGVSVSSSTTIKNTKKKAKETCVAGSVSSSVGGVTSTVSCEIK